MLYLEDIIGMDRTSNWMNHSVLFNDGHVDLADFAFNFFKPGNGKAYTIMTQRWN